MMLEKRGSAVEANGQSKMGTNRIFAPRNVLASSTTLWSKTFLLTYATHSLNAPPPAVYCLTKKQHTGISVLLQNNIQVHAEEQEDFPGLPKTPAENFENLRIPAKGILFLNG